MGKTVADLVVYGKIFTSEGNNKIVEAFAVKDGKFVYVGDKKGAEAFIKDGKTEIIDYTGKGLVMPTCGNGHAHYSIGHGVPKVGTMIDREITPEKFLSEVVPAAVKKAKDSGATSIFGFGWQILLFEKNMPTRQQLDAICSDIPMYFADEEGHKALVNTISLVNAGIMDENGNVLKKEVRGGENHKIIDGNHDKSLAVKCVNGTFVGKRTENIIAYRGILFVGNLRWKTPVDVVPNDSVYEAYFNAKSAYGNENLESDSLFYLSEDCLYLNIW